MLVCRTRAELKEGAGLNDTFARLERSQTVVYSDDVRRASVVWFSLQVLDLTAGFQMAGPAGT
jgi:hypothetical protein